MNNLFICHRASPTHKHNGIYCEEHIPSAVRSRWQAHPAARRFGDWFRLSPKHVEAQRDLRERAGGGNLCVHCREQSTTDVALTVGQHVTYTTEFKWRDGEIRGVHRFVYEMCVTSETHNAYQLDVVRLVSESGRPPFTESVVGIKGSTIAKFAIPNAIATGRISIK